MLSNQLIDLAKKTDKSRLEILPHHCNQVKQSNHNLKVCKKTLKMLENWSDINGLRKLTRKISNKIANNDI